MARSVVWTKAAADDFEAVAEYLAQDSPSYSSVFSQEIREASSSLSVFSERGRVVRELGESDIREIFVHSYRLIYRVELKRVTILALIHGRRELSATWREKDRET